MRNAASTLCALGLLAAATTGCIQHEGQLVVLLTAESFQNQSVSLNAQQVNVEITEVAVRDADSGQFITLSFGRQVYELLTLEDRSSVLAFADTLGEGTYTTVRIRFSEGNSSIVNAAGRKSPLSIEPTTVTVPASFVVLEDTQTTLTLSVDVLASVIQKANGTWVFRPVIRQHVDGR